VVEKRQWRYLPIEQVQEGDQLAEFGELKEKFWEGVDLIITSTFGRVERLPGGTMVHAYVKVPEVS
jgi:hypothetical protein